MVSVGVMLLKPCSWVRHKPGLPGKHYPSLCTKQPQEQGTGKLSASWGSKSLGIRCTLLRLALVGCLFLPFPNKKLCSSFWAAAWQRCCLLSVGIRTPGSPGEPIVAMLLL